MYVCLCNALTDREIREASADGGPVSAVYRRLGHRPRCGKCVAQVREALAEAAEDPRVMEREG